MARSLDELTVSWEEDGQLKVRQLDRVVLSHSTSWATIAFLYEELARGSSTEYGPKKVALRRYKRRGDRWVVDTRFVLSGAAQGVALQAALARWFEGGASASSSDEEG